MTYTRLLVLGDSHAPEKAAAHLASAGVLPVQATTGRIPSNLEGTAMWVATGNATSIRNAGVDLPLLSPGPSWLATVPGNLLCRKLICTTVGQLVNEWHGPGVIRLAEQQYGILGFERVYNDPRSFIAQVGKYHHRVSDLVAGVHVVVSTPVTYTDRYRVFIANGEISASTRIAASPNPGKRTDAYEGNSPDRTAAALHFAQKVIDATVWYQPPGFRIDVGATEDGAWQLISSGPSWSADFHEANPTGVVNAILAGQATDYDHWKWTPDDLFRRTIFRAWPAPANAV
ncbi:ATP-grasp domain-containing protein [Arthrobacter sp. UYCo732]|uniref:ATP-grasp domain-containing protein n=1 Tax=Arthrobacter sp. UYCo732 TaxID=3156336 RepID=UPI003396A42F